MKTVLPFSEPIINHTPATNCITGILNTYGKNLKQLVYEHYIQVYYGEKDSVNYEDIYSFVNWNGLETLRENWSQLSKAQLQSKIIDNINKGYYIFLGIDSFYVSRYKTYNVQHRAHDILILGYDLTRNAFMCADFFDFDRYQNLDCDANEIVDGIFEYRHTPISARESFTDLASLIKPKPEEVPPIDINKISLGIRSFLCEDFNNNNYRKHGIGVFDFLYRVFDEYYNCRSLPYKPTNIAQFLITHLFTMKDRYHYLCDNKILVNDTTISNTFETLCITVQFLKNKISIMEKRRTNNVSNEEVTLVLCAIIDLKQQYSELLNLVLVQLKN